MEYSHPSIYYLHSIKESLIAELEFEIHKVYIKEVLATMDISFGTLVPCRFHFMNIFFIRINFNTNNREDRIHMGNMSSIRYRIAMDYIYLKKNIILNDSEYYTVPCTKVVKKLVNQVIQKSFLTYHIDINPTYHRDINDNTILEINIELQFKFMINEMTLNVESNSSNYNLAFHTIATTIIDNILQVLNNLHLCNETLDKYLELEIYKELDYIKN